MGGSTAIESNRTALLRMVTGLVAMAGWAGIALDALGADGKTLPRNVRLAILRILRPAEAATRRLAIALSHTLPLLPPIRLRKLKPKPTQEYMEISPRNAVFPGQRKTGILVPRNTLKRFGADGTIQAYLIPSPMPVVVTAPPKRPGSQTRVRHRVFQLLDPLPNPARKRRRYAARSCQPRIWSPGSPHPVLLPPLSPRDQLDAAPLARRIAVLVDALGDLPQQARRYQRWQALRTARKTREAATGQRARPHRLSPLKPGRPSGCRLAGCNPDRFYRSKRIREIDEILAHAHDMALYVLEQPDTS
jgi:hypothetical protein